jgi:cell division septation protein DedD
VDSKQKQRIVGIIFLVILAVVAIPTFLKHSKENTASPTSEEAQQMAQEQSQALPNESVPMPPPPEANQQPLATDQPPPPSNNVAPNPTPAPAMPAPPTDGSTMQEESAEPMPAGMVNPTPAQPVITAPPAPATAPTAAAPISVASEPVSADPVKKPAVLKQTSKIEHQVEKTDWTIRLAIFSVRANADKLLSDLKKHGYHGSVEEINTYKGMTYKVTLKTKSSRADANKLATKLNNLFHINVMVSRTR